MYNLEENQSYIYLDSNSCFFCLMVVEEKLAEIKGVKWVKSSKAIVFHQI